MDHETRILEDTWLIAREQLLPPAAYADNPAMSLCTKHAHASLNKIKHPINVVKVASLSLPLPSLHQPPLTPPLT